MFILVLPFCDAPLSNFKTSEDRAGSSWRSVKTGFTLEVTPKKSGVEGGWDLASPYVVRPCLHAQWSCISGLVRGGDKNCHEV